MQIWLAGAPATAPEAGALVCPAGAEPLGVKGPRRGDDDNRSGSQESTRKGTLKGRKRTFDRRNTNWQRGREPRASKRV